jgi:hypothetical protein
MRRHCTPLSLRSLTLVTVLLWLSFDTVQECRLSILQLCTLWKLLRLENDVVVSIFDFIYMFCTKLVRHSLLKCTQLFALGNRRRGVLPSVVVRQPTSVNVEE